jgi:hypothetical protein
MYLLTDEQIVALLAGRLAIADLPTVDFPLWISVSEVSRRWCLHVRTVRDAIEEGKLMARQHDVGAVWMVFTSSALLRWGDPVVPFDSHLGVKKLPY